jgi:hypothetical protein
MICFDLDGAMRDGDLHPDVRALVEAVDSFTEVSRSKNSLHVLALIDCEAFSNILQATIGNCKVDVLCRSQIAVTGDVYEGYADLGEITQEFLEALPFFERKSEKADVGDFWDRESLGGEQDLPDLEQQLTDWQTCIKGGGGDKHYFVAALKIVRYGFTGPKADELLQLVERVPPATEAERAHKLVCAYQHAVADGTFATLGSEHEFDDLEVVDSPAEGSEEEEDFGFKDYTAEELEDMDLKLEYIVDQAFIDKQPLFIGGREKCFKTGCAMDLLVSLASGTPFMGRFDTLGVRSSVMFTAEIGLAPAQHLLRRIRQSKGIERGNLHNLRIVDMVPTFQLNKLGQPVDPKGMAKLKRYLDKRKPEIAVFDPLYFAMGGAAVGDMYEIGAVLKHISDVCKEREIWPIFCHHAKKDSSKEYQPMDLSDFYGSGVSAFARQWLLMSHREPYAHGCAKLFAKMGGSASGGGDLWLIDIDEGRPDAIIDRVWSVSVNDGGEQIGGVCESQILECLKMKDGEYVKKSEIAAWCGVEEKKIRGMISHLLKANRITSLDNKYAIVEDFDAL